MFRYILSFLTIFSLLNIVKSNVLYYSDILECNYNFNNLNELNSRMILSIDNNNFRETVAYPNIKTYFAIPVSRKDYNISYYFEGNNNLIPEISCKYSSGLFLDKYMKNNDLVIKNNNVELYQNSYYYDRKHILNIHLIISMKPYDTNQDDLYLEFYFNNNLVKFDTLNTQYPMTSYKLELEGEEGNNYLELSASTNGIWCSCPSIYNGYHNNRYLVSWITEIEKDEYSNTINIISSYINPIASIKNLNHTQHIISI